MAENKSYTRLSSPDAEAAATELLATNLAPRTDRLQERLTKPESAAVAPGSPLAGDNTASRPFQLSHAAYFAIVHAADNLHALRLLTVRETGPNHLTVVTHPYAAYPLLRAALENASMAVWLLAPSNRDARLTRRFRLLLKDAKNGDEEAALLGHEAATHAKRLDRMEPILTARPTISLNECKNVPGFRSIVRQAAEGHDSDPVAAVAVWKLLSGLTHGDVWASQTATERDEVSVSEDGVVTMKTTSSIANIANMTAYVFTFVEAAVRLYDLRRAPLHPEA